MIDVEIRLDGEPIFQGKYENLDHVAVLKVEDVIKRHLANKLTKNLETCSR